jgi:hypothetical protein
MSRRIATIAAVAMLTFPAFAQDAVIVPGAPVPIPLPPPPPPPVLVVPPAQGAPPPPRLNTFSDKVGRCVDYGAAQGLPPGQLDAYTRACANN